MLQADTGAAGKIRTAHRFMAREATAAALQPSFKATRKPTPTRSVPGHRSTLGACPRSSGLGGSLSTSRSLLFSTRLLQGLLSFVQSCCSNWLEANHRPGQHWAPAQGHAHSCKPGVQLCTPMPPGCPIRSASPLPAAPFPAPARSPGQQELCRWRCRLPRPCLGAGLSLRVCSQHTQHEASAEANS